jgi:hypothetical protein
MPTGRRLGWSDVYREARLTNLTGTTYPAAPASLYVALCRGQPSSDGSDLASLEVLRVGPIAYGAPQSIAGSGSEGSPIYRVVMPSAAVSFTAPGTLGSGAHTDIVAWALMQASSGGVPIYVGLWSGSLAAGATTVVPASLFQIAAESI